MPKQSKTNGTTRSILSFLTSQGCFVWRQNVLPIPVAREGTVSGYRSGGKSGVPDIIGVLGPDVLPTWWGGAGGMFLGVEIKTGNDTLRDEQIGFHKQARKLGAIILVVKDFDDFMQQWTELKKLKS